jgi:hypothetical protein
MQPRIKEVCMCTCVRSAIYVYKMHTLCNPTMQFMNATLNQEAPLSYIYIDIYICHVCDDMERLQLNKLLSAHFQV